MVSKLTLYSCHFDIIYAILAEHPLRYLSSGHTGCQRYL